MRMSQWVLLILAAGFLAAYFGVLGPVVDALEEKVGLVEAQLDQKDIGQPRSGVRARLESLGQTDPRLDRKFVDPQDAWMEALVVLTLFVFVTPIALIMGGVIVFFLMAALAALAPSFIPHKIAMLILTVVTVIVVYMTSSTWGPSVQYYAGWVARAYLIVTSG
jgi:hypothetical protein